MLPIGELVRVAALLDEHHRCSLVDRVAELWGATGATFVRSRATHVFLSDPDRDGRRVVLRMAPIGDPAAVLVEPVDGPVVTAVQHVPGTSYDLDLDPDTARAWGRSRRTDRSRLARVAARACRAARSRADRGLAGLTRRQRAAA